jgi:uncharacterized protein (TIGR02271 family)
MVIEVLVLSKLFVVSLTSVFGFMDVSLEVSGETSQERHNGEEKYRSSLRPATKGTPSMVDTGNTWNITGGMDVVGVDDEKVGDVADVQHDYIVVSKGFFFPTDYYIPLTAVTSVTDKVYLNVTKDEALNQGWDLVPDASVTTTEAYDDRPIVDAGLHIDNPVDADAAAMADRNEDGTIDVALRDEELRAGTREVERGQAQVEKVVTEDQQTIEVPVTEERLTVTRRPATEADVDAGVTMDEGTITVPLRGEEVVVEKDATVREVVEIGKEAVTHTERVTDTVRHEDVQVREGTGEVVEETNTRRKR